MAEQAKLRSRPASKSIHMKISKWINDSMEQSMRGYRVGVALVLLGVAIMFAGTIAGLSGPAFIVGFVFAGIGLLFLWP